MPPQTQPGQTESPGADLARIPGAIRLAFTSFLAVPTLMVGAFLLLATGTYALDRRQIAWLAPLHDLLKAHVFGSAEATAQLLATAAAGMITVTSITFSLLLVALQQSAGSMTHAVFDQFLRRRLNQAYAGWFIGLTLYTLITLATVAPPFNPVFGATMALALAISGLYVILLLIYAVIEQMRPEAILESIHDHALRARASQRALLRRTGRRPTGPWATGTTARAAVDGFVAGIDLALLERALAAAEGEIVLRLPIGGYTAYRDPIAEVYAASPEAAAALVDAVVRAVRIDRRRDIDHDPAYALEQLEAIAWTSISTAKQDPTPGLEAIRDLRDLLARWATDDADDEEKRAAGELLPVVYPDDVLEQLMETFASLAIVTTESMQHQVYAEILAGFATMLDGLPAPLGRRVEAVVLSSLAGLGDHVLSPQLDRALHAIVAAFEREGYGEGSAAVLVARDELARSSGHLNSRSTRVPRR